jgi:hypothetical protein
MARAEITAKGMERATERDRASTVPTNGCGSEIALQRFSKKNRQEIRKEIKNV